MKKYVLVAYAMEDSLNAITKEHASMLTHINVAFGLVKENLVTVSHLKNLDAIETIKNYNPEIKILLSIGGWGAGGFSEAAATEEGRNQFAESAIQIMLQYNFDGLDIDWEYPCSPASGICYSQEDKYTFTLLLKCIREKLNALPNKYMLTIAAGASKSYVERTEMQEVAKYLDYVQLMTYDMSGFDKITGHHANLYSPEHNKEVASADLTVNIFANAGVPKEKLVVGSAFYSRMWKDVPKESNGLHQVTKEIGTFGPTFQELQENYINKNGYTKYWDNICKAPFLYNGDSFLTYDDQQSLAEKSCYVKENNLAGIMFWEYGYDKTGTLIKCLKEGLNDTK